MLALIGVCAFALFGYSQMAKLDRFLKRKREV